MALFYDRIKGCGSRTTGKDNGVFTYLDWADLPITGDDTRDINDMKYNPTISYCSFKDDTDGDDTRGNGYILSSDMKNGYIKNDFTFYNTLTFTLEGSEFYNAFIKYVWDIDDVDAEEGDNTGLYIHGDYMKIKCPNRLNIYGSEIEVDINNSMTFNYDDDSIIEFHEDSDLQLTIKPNTEITSTLKVDGSITTLDHIDSPYFNATSDARAKHDIKSATFDALSIVSSLPIYTFNYNKDNTPSIGVIAQEAKEIDFGTDFNLVNNQEARGENEDYMTVKESKMVYVLWKAVQEQQEIIKQLQKELSELKK